MFIARLQCISLRIYQNENFLNKTSMENRNTCPVHVSCTRVLKSYGLCENETNEGTTRNSLRHAHTSIKCVFFLFMAYKLDLVC